MSPLIYPISETAITVEWGKRIDDELHQQVLMFNHLLHQAPFLGFVETVPAYASLTIYYRPELIALERAQPYLFVTNHVEQLLRQPSEKLTYPGNFVSIPVCYDPEFGPDLEYVAAAKGISKETLIAIHQQNHYKVYMMGFLPGFAYMGALDDTIATARKPTPRERVEAGSVGIAWNQTGIYPIPSPGGWQIIGRTPCRLFVPEKTVPFLLKTGDRVAFYAIEKEEFYKTADQSKGVPELWQREGPADAMVLKPGIYSTLQDKGRFGFRAYGVPLGGAMDGVSHQIANALVGNSHQAATIECTMGGLSLQFVKDAVVALTGGGAALLNGSPIQLYQCHDVSENDVLELRFSHQGIRTYVAVQGGFASKKIMGSKSMSPMADIGTPLSKGTGLRFGNDFSTKAKKTASNSRLQWSVQRLKSMPELGLPHFKGQALSSPQNIRVCQGPEHGWMAAESIRQFYSQKFTLTSRSDRMGCHLQGEPLLLGNAGEMLSTAVTKGTIQLTPNGQLIVLMSDCQTTGGYPRVGQIAAADLPLVAQLTPGETIAFSPLSFAEAEASYLQQQKTIDALFS